MTDSEFFSRNLIVREFIDAAEKGDCSQLDYFLQNKVNLLAESERWPNYNALQIAIRNERIEFVKFLLNHDCVQFCDAYGNALHCALWNTSRASNIEMIQLLCFKEVLVNQLDKHSRTPLHFAVVRNANSQEIIECLLLFGAHVEERHIFYAATRHQEFLLQFIDKNLSTEKKSILKEEMGRIRCKFGIKLMQFAQSDIIGICIAFAPLDLPPYILLWIMDWLPNYDKLSHRKKIDLITSVRDSIWKFKNKEQIF